MTHDMKEQASATTIVRFVLDNETYSVELTPEEIKSITISTDDEDKIVLKLSLKKLGAKAPDLVPWPWMKARGHIVGDCSECGAHFDWTGSGLCPECRSMVICWHHEDNYMSREEELRLWSETKLQLAKDSLNKENDTGSNKEPTDKGSV